MDRFRKILLINDNEGAQVAFFLILLLCLGTGMAIGRGTADALFLKRYGIEYLPIMYLLLSCIYIVFFVIYAAFVDRLSSERFFLILLVLQAVTLSAIWLIIINGSSEYVYPAYFLLYELISEIILIHATFYIGQNLDTLQSKRLMPIILAGYQMGMVVGGLILVSVVPVIGVENAIIIWLLLISVSAILLISWHKKRGESPFYIPPSRSRRNRVTKAIKEVGQGLVFTRQSELLRNSSYALFFMVIMFYVLSFSVKKIYSESFENEAELTRFFGILVASANLAALFLQLFVTNRIIEKIGVRKSKLIFPVTSLVSYFLLIINPSFYIAIVASINNNSIMPAFRNPVRQMFFNVLPGYMKGRARATSVAIVLPVAMFVCGGLILYLQTANDPALIIYIGFFCAILYFLFCVRMGKVYVSALINNMKEKLYIPSEVEPELFLDNNDRIYNALLKGLQNEDEKVSLSYAKIILRVFPNYSLDPVFKRIQHTSVSVADQMVRLIPPGSDESIINMLLTHADDRDDHFKATIYDIIFSDHADEYKDLIDAALIHSNPRIKSSGIKGALLQSSDNLFKRGMNTWNELITGGIHQQMAAIEIGYLLVGINDNYKPEMAEQYKNMYAKVIIDADAEQRKQIYKAMSLQKNEQKKSVCHAISIDIESHDPELRARASTCLHLLPNDHIREDIIWSALGDGHGGVRNAALDCVEQLTGNSIYKYHEWILNHKKGTPRAQKILLQTMIKHGINHSALEQIVESKVNYASILLSALETLIGEKDNSSAKYMMQTLIDERLSQTIDLILIAMEPITGSDVLSIVRAGLSCQDDGHKANAQETLQNIDNNQYIAILTSLVERNYKKTTKLGYGRKFNHARDVLHWCVENGDSWLGQCGSYAITTSPQ